jgi:hypothetical protein
VNTDHTPAGGVSRKIQKLRSRKRESGKVKKESRNHNTKSRRGQENDINWEICNGKGFPSCRDDELF